MPVPQLSREFYETFGDKVATQLITWFNEVDTTYRTELRTLNEVNFARFDAKLEQRIAEVKAELRQEIAALRADLRSEFHQAIGGLRSEFHETIGGLRAEFHRELGLLRGDLIKWTFAFWVGSTATTAGLVFAMLKMMR